MTQKITHKMWMRGEHKDMEPTLTWCEGSHKKLDVIPEWSNITPMWMGKCGFCWEDMKPNTQGIAPKHPPARQRFTFITKYPDVCQIGWHPIPAGTRARYFGVKLVCKDHA